MRRFTFSLRTMLLAVVVASAIAGLGYRAYEPSRQRKVLADLEGQGCVFVVDGDVESWRDLGFFDPPMRRVKAASVGLAHLSMLSPMQNIEHLTLGGFDGDLAPIGKLKSLTTLRCEGVYADDYTALGELTNLEDLFLSATIRDLSPIAKLHRLKYLSLGWVPARNFDVLVECKHLSHLYYRASALPLDNAHLESIARITTLEYLHLGSSEITDLEPLRELTHLKRLGISYADKLETLEPLYSLQYLEEINLRGTNISDEEVAELNRHLPDCKVTRLKTH